MRKTRGIATAFVLLASLLGANAANAGIPVIDAANLAQSIQQVISWVGQNLQMAQQIQNQATQIANQITQIARITGTRNLGQVFNNPLMQKVVPANVSTVMGAVGTQGFQGLTNPAQALRTATMIYNCADKPIGPIRTACQAPLSVNAQAQTWSTAGLTTVTQRVQEIQNIQQQINTTADPMAIGQVQAALQAETAQVTNDQNRIALMNANIQAAQAAIQQAEVERNLAMTVKNAPTVADNLVFP
jgi:type IV secretion system protein VirB5